MRAPARVVMISVLYFRAETLRTTTIATQRFQHAVGHFLFPELPQNPGHSFTDTLLTIDLSAVAEQRDKRTDRTCVPDLSQRFDRPDPEPGGTGPQNGREGRNGCGIP